MSEGKKGPGLAIIAQPDCPQFYPEGTPEEAGSAHIRIYKARKAAGIRRRDSGVLDSDQLRRYRQAYADPRLEGIVGALRTPDKSVHLGSKLTPAEAFEVLICWLKE